MNSAGHLRASRRTFLRQATLAASTAGALSDAVDSQVFAAATTTEASPSPGTGLTDVNICLGRWPFRRLPDDEPGSLVRLLKRHQVRQAWTGCFEALFHKDPGGLNERLWRTCRESGEGILLPFGTVNPARTGWERDLDDCRQRYQMHGVRLHPNYHGYTLDDPRFAELLQKAAALGLIVQIALVMEDERMMHPLGRVAPVDTTPLATLVRQTPGLRLVLINALRTLRARPLLDLLATDKVWVEISMLEGVGGLETLLAQVPTNRVLFGSHAPLFYFESALLKLRESELTGKQMAAICRTNARELLKSKS